MKILIFVTLISFSFSQKYANRHDDDCRHCEDFSNYTWGNNEIENGEMIVYKRGRAILEIERDGTLIVRGKQVDTSRKQRRMLVKYVEHFEYVVDQSIEIGLDGADIGITAAKEVVNALFSFNIDKMEEKLERMEEKLEKKSDAIEEKAEELEFHAEEFVAIRCMLKRQIDQLDDIEEF